MLNTSFTFTSLMLNCVNITVVIIKRDHFHKTFIPARFMSIKRYKKLLICNLKDIQIVTVYCCTIFYALSNWIDHSQNHLSPLSEGIKLLLQWQSPEPNAPFPKVSHQYKSFLNVANIIYILLTGTETIALNSCCFTTRFWFRFWS
jgi:hypothetical protein